jgi:homoserine kinase type II
VYQPVLGLSGIDVTVHNGGMGSQTWYVDPGARRWVAGGMAIAHRLEQAGIPAGDPVPTRDGSLLVNLDGNWLALLTWVPGRALAGQDDAELALIGSTLAQVHRTLAGYEVEAAQRFHWVDPAADHLSFSAVMVAANRHCGT